MGRVIPTVSIIVPTHNCGPLVRRALASVAIQTFRDFEVIVVDDASTDETAGIVEASKGLFPDAPLRYLWCGQRRGAAAARNKGLDTARGAYIALLDVDDEWRPTKLEKQVRVFAGCSAHVGLLTTRYQLVDVHGWVAAEYPRDAQEGNLSARLLDSIERREEIIGVFSTLMFRRAVIDAIGGLDENLPCWHDTDFYLRAAERFEFGFIAETLTVKHERSNSISYTRSTQAVGSIRFWQKHASRFQSRPGFRRFIARHQHALGVQACLTGNVREGRRLFCASLALALGWRPAVHLAVSLAGSRAYAAFSSGRRWRPVPST